MNSGLKNRLFIVALAFVLACCVSTVYAQQENNSRQGKAGKVETRAKESTLKEKAATGNKQAGADDKKKTAAAGTKTAGTQQANPFVPFGFVDKDKDGVNDLFVDANGDGVNDITGEPYAHNFQFADEDEDGVNDLYVDADGDGVNDLEVSFVDVDEDGINDNVIDTNGDYINDITGLKYTSKSLRGYKFGFIKEERALMKGFVDEDGDGLADFRQMRMRGASMSSGQQDMFIDTDGDGIDDRRHSMKRMRRGRNE